MQQSPANLGFVNLSSCFLKPLVPTASRGKVLQSLMTRGVKSLCLPLVFHLLATPQVPALWGQCSHCAQLATPGTHVCELWTSVIPPARSFHFQPILVSGSWGGRLSHTFDRPRDPSVNLPQVKYTLAGVRGAKLHRVFKVQAREKYTQWRNNNNSFPSFFKKKKSVWFSLLMASWYQICICVKIATKRIVL